MTVVHHNSESAAEALAFIEQSRTRLAAASDVPPLRHAVFAAMMGTPVASSAAPFPLRIALMVGLFAGIAWVVRWDRRRTGMFVNGYRAGRTRWVALTLLAVILPIHVAGVWLATERGIGWAPLALGVLAAAIAYAGSLWWCRVFRREMLGTLA